MSDSHRRPALLAGAVLCALAAGVLVVPTASADPTSVDTPSVDTASVDTASADTPAADAVDAGARPTPGAAGLGDTLYPTLGNGGYQVVRYDLDLRYATAAPSQALDGTVTIAAVATRALSRFDLDFGGTSVGSVSVNGRPARFARNGDELVITPHAPLPRGPFTVTVSHFRSSPVVPGPDAAPDASFIQTPDGTVWAGQPAAMHKIFPCNDHPSDKATFSFTIDVPAGTTAVANGRLAGRSTSGGRTVWRYEEPEPMATELAQVAVGALTVTPRPRTSGTAIRDVTPTRLTAQLDPKLATETGHLTWLESKVGDYPFATYGSLVADAQLGFALETQTLSLYDNVFFADRPNPVDWEPVMVHELAHQWFGDSVAPTRWQDVWQSEGHATWYEFRYAAEKGYLPEYIGYPDLTEVMRQIYLRNDQWRADYGPVGSPRGGSLDELFNINVYYGGALVLYALQQTVGEATFAKIERAWVSRYRGTSASTADYIALASAISGKDLAPFLRDWLYSAKTPPMPGHPDWTSNPPTTPTPSASARTAATPSATLGSRPFVRH